MTNDFQAQAQQARSQLEIQKSRIAEEEAKLQAQVSLFEKLAQRQPQKKLGFQHDPQYLRQLEEFKQRQQVSPQLAEARRKLAEFKEQMSKWEGSVSAGESQLKEFQSEQNAYRSAQHMFDKGMPWTLAEGKTKQYLKSMYRSRSFAKQSFAKRMEELQEQLPEGEKLVFTDGRLAGISSEAFQQSMTIEGYNQMIEAVNKEVLEAQKQFDFYYTPKGLPRGVVSKQPTYSEIISGRPIAESERYFFEKISGFGTKIGSGKYGVGYGKEEYQAVATGKLAKLGAQIAIYTALPAPVVLSFIGATGLETAFTEKGRKELKYLGEKYLEPYHIPKEFAYAKPIAEAGLGIYGVTRGVKGALITKEIAQFEKTPMTVAGYRIEAETKGMDFLLGLKKVGKGKPSYYVTEIAQPYYVTKTGALLERGLGVGVRVKGAKLDVSRFASGGRIITLKKTPKLVKETLEEPYLFTDISKITKELKGLESGAGKIYTKEIYKAGLKIKKGVEFPTGRLALKVKGKFQPPREKEWSTFVGAGREEKEVISIFGARAKTARYYQDIEKYTVTGKIDVLGKIKRITPKPTYEITDVEKALQLKQKQIPPYQEALVEKALKTTLPKQPPLSQITKTPAIVGITTKQDMKAIISTPKEVYAVEERALTRPISEWYGKGLYERTEATATLMPKADLKLSHLNMKEILKTPSLSTLKFEILEKQRDGVASASKLSQQMAQVEKNALKSALQTKQILKQQPRQRQRMAQSLRVEQLLRQKQAQRTMQKMTQVYMIPKLRFKPKPFPLIPPLFKFDISRDVLKKKIEKKRREKVWTYTPSFTARALGLKPLKLGTDISLKKLMREMRTGLGVRRAVVIMKKKRLKKNLRRKKK